MIDSLQIQEENSKHSFWKWGNHLFLLSMHKVGMRLICIQGALYDKMPQFVSISVIFSSV